MSDKIKQEVDRDGFEEHEESDSPPIAWTDYGPLTVAVTRSTWDGSLIVHVENRYGDGQLPVRVAEASNPRLLWEGML